MKTWVRKTLSVGVLAAGALLLAPSAAHADVSQETSHNNGILNGTQLVAPVSVPVNVVGNAIGVAGEAGAAGAGWNKGRTEGGKQSSKNNNGILNGTQAYLPVSVPVNVVGNAVAVLGQATAIGTGVNGKHTESARTESGRGADQSTSGNNGIANGTQIYSPIDIPINICGNSLALLGQAHAAAVCTNKGFGESGRANQSSKNNNGIANGTQVYAPVSLPVNLSGNAIGVLGAANAAAASSNESGHAGGGIKQSSKNNNGILNGTQIAAPVHVPVNVCGNALSILGASKAAASCSNGGNGGHHGGNHNGGDHGTDYKPDAGGDNYSSPSGHKGGRNADARTKTTEQSPVSSVTEGLPGLGGVTLLDTLG
ncbi:MAG TPA: chaplin family protein [Actinoplanes sp.]|nr:chaplin family protein [Actinoplanes sp.]